MEGTKGTTKDMDRVMEVVDTTKDMEEVEWAVWEEWAAAWVEEWAVEP